MPRERRFGEAWLKQYASPWIAHHWTGIEAGIPSQPFTANCCRNVTLVTSPITGSHVTTRKFQFAEEGLTLQVESFALVWTFNKFYPDMFCSCNMHGTNMMSSCFRSSSLAVKSVIWNIKNISQHYQKCIFNVLYVVSEIRPCTTIKPQR